MQHGQFIVLKEKYDIYGYWINLQAIFFHVWTEVENDNEKGDMGSQLAKNKTEHGSFNFK